MNQILIALGTAAFVLTTPAFAAPHQAQPLVDAAWLAQNLGAPNLLVIDIRDPKPPAFAYGAGHIPGAVSAPYGDYGWRAKVNGVPGMLPPIADISAKIGALGVGANTHVVILAQGSDSTEFGKATRVYWTFEVLGHDAVSILDGGQNAWLAANGALSTAPTTAQPTTFTAAFRPELLATADAVRAAITDPTELVDGRPIKQFQGKEKSPVVRAAGTIPTALNLDQSSFYNGKFVDSGLISQLRTAAGLDASAPTITFCNTGHWASIAWFGLSEVGGQENVSMYDGSLADWSQDPKNPLQ